MRIDDSSSARQGRPRRGKRARPIEHQILREPLEPLQPLEPLHPPRSPSHQALLDRLNALLAEARGDTPRESIVLRVLGGVLWLLMVGGGISTVIRDGEWQMLTGGLFLGAPFLVYCIGGNKLIRRVQEYFYGRPAHRRERPPIPPATAHLLPKKSEAASGPTDSKPPSSDAA